MSEKTKTLMHQYYIIKTCGNLVPSFFKGFLIEKYSINMLFFISAFLSIFILVSGIILEEDKDKKKDNGMARSQSRIEFTPIIEKKNSITNINNEKFKIIVLLLALVFILELTPTCANLFHYETKILGFSPFYIGLLDCFCQLSIILFIILNNRYFSKSNLRAIIFFVRILIFLSFYLVYLLVTKNTQKYIDDFILIAFSSALRAGLISLGKMPYRILCFKYSPFGYGAIIFAISDAVCTLGNMGAVFIDIACSSIFNVTKYNFINFDKLVLSESILNLLPLIYIWIPESQFFSVEKEKSSAQELSPIENENNENNNNIINVEENKDENMDSNEFEKEKEKIARHVADTLVYNEDGDMSMYYNYDDLTIVNYNSYRYISGH